LPSEKPARRLLDIVENGQAILRYTAGMDPVDFAQNRLVYDAVERCLERISEAVVKLGELATGSAAWSALEGHTGTRKPAAP
jgi:uncharacterized protein with HEPN domain